MAKSFIVKYSKIGPGTMIGGVRRSLSSRWASRSDAESYAEVVSRNNGGPGVVTVEIVESKRNPEVCGHCTTNRHPGTYVCVDCWAKATA